MRYQPNTPEVKSKINQINQLEDYYDTLRESVFKIEDAKEDIENYQNQLVEIEEKIKILTEEKITIEKQLNQLKETIPFDKYKKFQSSMEKTDVKITLHRNELQELIMQGFNTHIQTMNSKNTMYKTLDRQTKTTPIMDEFCESKTAQFLVLNTNLYSPNYKGIIKLVITPAFYNIKDAGYTSPTMTELKNNGSKSINANFPERMKPLISEIQKYDFKKIPFGDKKQFAKPFELGGQTSDNQTGYGWEWEWGDCISEGTLYGEVTDFFIIGFIYEDKYNWNNVK